MVAPVRALWSLLFGPVFQKEVYVSGRRTSTYYIRAAVALLLFAVLILACIPLAFEGSQGEVVRLQQSQQLAATLTGVVIGFDFAILMFFTPILMVPSVMEEVVKRTLPALLTTPISAAEIILGKLLGRGINLVVLALIPIPVLLVLRTMGGVPGDVIVASVAMLLSATILIGTMAILISVWARKPGAGIVASFIFFAAIQGIPPLTLALISQKWRLLRVPEDMIASCSVFSSLAFTLIERLGGESLPGLPTTYMWIYNSLYNLSLAAVFLLVAVLMLRRVMRREGTGQLESGPSISVVPTSVVSENPQGQIHVPAAQQTERDRREVGDQPVFWREIRQPIFAKAKHLVLAIVAGLGLLGFIFYLGSDSPGDALQISLGIALVLSLLGSAVLTTGSIGTERDSQTWEVLLTTSLSANEILWGKFLGILKRQLIVPALGVLFLLIIGMGILERAHPRELLVWVCYSGGPIFFFSASGVFFSLLWRKSTVAAVWNLLIALALWAVLPAAVALTCYPLERYLFQQETFTESVLSWCLIINPVFSFPSALAAGYETAWSTSSQVEFAGNYSLSRSTFTVVACVVAAGYIAAGCAMLWLAKQLFPRLSGRVTKTPVSGSVSLIPAS